MLTSMSILEADSLPGLRGPSVCTEIMMSSDLCCWYILAFLFYRKPYCYIKQFTKDTLDSCLKWSFAFMSHSYTVERKEINDICLFSFVLSIPCVCVCLKHKCWWLRNDWKNSAVTLLLKKTNKQKKKITGRSKLNAGFSYSELGAQNIGCKDLCDLALKTFHT